MSSLAIAQIRSMAIVKTPLAHATTPVRAGQRPTTSTRFRDSCRRTTVIDAIEAIHDRAEAQMRAALRSIPDGTYAGEEAKANTIYAVGAGAKFNEGDALTTGPSSAINDGKFDIRQSGRFHRVTVSMTGDHKAYAYAGKPKVVGGR